MKFKLLFLSFLLAPFFINAQITKKTDLKLKQVIEEFRLSIIEHSDFEKFSNLFLHDSITWASIVTGKTKKIILKKKTDLTFQTSDYKRFFEILKDGFEEKFYNVQIDVRNDFATISFDYSFNINSKIQNWGTEYWSLVLVNDAWKITSVTWSNNIEKIEKCPFRAIDLFKLN